MVRMTLLFLATFLFLGATALEGQEKEKRKVGSIRAGFHSANMVLEEDDPDTTHSLNNFYIGFSRDTRIIPILWFGSGIEYFQNGLKYTDNLKRVVHTISVPLDLKVKVGPVYALTGFAANFKVSEKIIAGDNSIDPLEEDKANWFDAPFFLGAGVKIAFVSVEARYHWGTIEARNSLYNRYLQIGAALTF